MLAQPGIVIDINDAGVIVANMVLDFLAAEQSREDIDDEPEDSRTSPSEPCLHLPPSIDDGAGTVSPGEHQAPVCPERKSDTLTTSDVASGYESERLKSREPHVPQKYRP